MHLLQTLRALLVRVPRRQPAQMFESVRAGRAVIVDVREAAEWKSGVAEGALRLPLSDLVGSRKRWATFLETVGEREVLLYCKAGGRSAIAAKVLRREGFNAADTGALKAWTAAGWPIEKLDPEGR